MNDVPTIVVDARWLNKMGTTTFSRMLLEGLAEARPPGRWVLWGAHELIEATRWPGVVHVPTSVDPSAWFGQQSAFRVPRADVVLHPHQTRPLHTRPAATCVLDLIQLDHPSPVVRKAKALRLGATVKAAQALFTISSVVRTELVERFGVDPRSVTVLALPVDAAAAARIAGRRLAEPTRRYLLTMGRFCAHKNLNRLVEAFGNTRFAAAGGELHLVGGTERQLALGSRTVPAHVKIRGVLDQNALEDALVGATAIVMPSLVEGFGLPVAEGLASGIPVTSSPVPAAVEFGPAGLPTFDPRSVPDITRAIDETVDLVDNDRYWLVVDRQSWMKERPTSRSLAEQVIQGLNAVAFAQ